MKLSGAQIKQDKISKATILFVFITITIDVIGFGLVVPIMPKLIAELKNISIG